MKILVVDYGMGNLKSIISTLKFLNVEDVVVSSNHDEIRNSDKLILPGVGSFVKAMENIKKIEIDKILYEVSIENKKPLLGICLGMQLLSLSSEEDGGAEGLGFINGICKKFNSDNIKVPHVGFNQVKKYETSRLYDGLEKDNDFYFTHSFRLTSDSNIGQSYCNYGEYFIASYEIENIAGTQFHPELSQTNGLKLLANFIEKF